MTKAETLIAVVADRGLKLAIKDGVPVIRGDRAQVTPALLDALKRHRAAIIEHLTAEANRNVEVTI